MLSRRGLLQGGLGLGVLGAGCRLPPNTASGAAPKLDSWEGVRALFSLSPGYIHMAGFYLAAHPAPVRDAIEEIRKGLDADTFLYMEEHYGPNEKASRQALADYLGADPSDIALTESTTAGLGLLYGGLQLLPGQEILTTTHDHYSSAESLRLSAERAGVPVRQIPLHDGAERASVEGIVGAIRAGITPKTRLVAVTWVHSSTGLKLPIPAIAAAVAEANAGRAEEDRALLSVDGVHGVGVDGETVGELGCDFLISGCHKWLHGPRGTGFIWGKKAAWAVARPTVPSFSGAVGNWIRGEAPPSPANATLMSPGGFHAFEHRWAIPAAVKLHQQIGKAKIGARIHSLSRQLKEGLAEMPHVTLRTPMRDELSGGVVCFDVAGLGAEEVVARLLEKKIVASVPPYPRPHARLATSIYNTPEEVEAALRGVKALA
jgi:isopenicillin-N epimerase